MLTPENIEAAIDTEEYIEVDSTTTTLCVLNLWNGFVITGKSVCIDPADFNAEIGRQIARKDAVGQIWQLERYRILSEIARQEAP